MQHQQPTLSTKVDNQALAASMMQKIQSIEETDMDMFSMEAQYRDGKPQSNILLDYLKSIQAQTKPH
ncbi:MAG: hypothetical protein H0X43_10315 [Nitrosospira sp.]|nr:hypothetical protein [Nitrosospira sp.]